MLINYGEVLPLYYQSLYRDYQRGGGGGSRIPIQDC